MKKILTLCFYIFIAAVAIISLALLLPAFHKLRKMKIRVAELETELSDRIDECHRLNKLVYDLKNNPNAVEKVAREKFSLCRPGEVIYTYETPEKPPPVKEKQAKP